MSELASAMPTAGGIYYWASKLGGAGWGWFTGWFNLIGLVAVSASVIYVCGDVPDVPARPLRSPLHLQLHQGRRRNERPLHRARHFALFAVILVVAGWSTSSQPARTVLYSISVWWNIVGVLVIVVLLIAVPSHHASFSYVFSQRPTNRASRRAVTARNSGSTCCRSGFLLTMYTITGYDASAHVSEETHGADELGAEGRLALGPLLGGLRLDRAAGDHVRDPEEPRSRNLQSRLPGADDHQTALTSAAAKAVLLISTIGQLFCGMACVTSASRMTFAFSRDGAVPGHNLWRRLGKSRTPTWAVLFVCVFALIITIPAYFPNHLGTRWRSWR